VIPGTLVATTNQITTETKALKPEVAQTRWQFSRAEQWGLVLALAVILAFGALIEKRTALRRVPMTDLGVFACAAWALQSGEDFYAVTDWHGWHYHYPPMLAILFKPLAEPVPKPPTESDRSRRTPDNTPWGYSIASGRNYYGLHAENRRFFWIVAVWYALSVCMTLLSAHLLACTLERTSWRAPPPGDSHQRQQWWWLRLAPLLLCIVSVGTDLSRGQVDLLMLFTLSVALYQVGRRRDWVAGVFASVPAAIKLFPPFYLFLPLWLRRWRLVGGILLGLLLALVLVPAAALGPARTVDAYRTWLDVLARPSLGSGHDTSRAVELTNVNASDNQSLLAFIHNWTFRYLPLKERPLQASPGARRAVYWVGGLMLLALMLCFGRHRRESPKELLLITGLLTGMAFVLSPVVHNFYYLMMMPLLGGMAAHVLESPDSVEKRGIVAALLLFMGVDILARMPSLGRLLRDLGVPLLSLILLMVIGAILLRRTATTGNSPTSLPVPSG
jgi:hypothetical protein